MEQNDLNIFENTGFDEASKAHLLETTRWTKFLAVIGFIFTGILLIAALAFMFLGASLSSYSTDFAGTGMGIGIGILYIVIAALYVYPVFALLKFSTCIKRGLNTGSQELITEGFRYQKNMYRFIGILMIITIAIYLLIFLFAGIGLLNR